MLKPKITNSFIEKSRLQIYQFYQFNFNSFKKSQLDHYVHVY
jgi:hypothetical protein